MLTQSVQTLNFSVGPLSITTMPIKGADARSDNDDGRVFYADQKNGVWEGGTPRKYLAYQSSSFIVVLDYHGPSITALVLFHQLF